ncbi:MAG: HAMP domain-containing protein, partial [Candidatus Acidiferrales bacterium]
MNAEQRKRDRRVRLVVTAVIVAILAAVVFTLGSLRPPIRPERNASFPIFFGLSLIFALAFFVLLFVFSRYLVHIASDRVAGKMGSRFKVKMVAGAMGLSLLPLVFLFFVSYALVNRSLEMWFPRPLEIANEQSQMLVSSFGKNEFERLSRMAADAAVRSGDQVRLLAQGHAVDAAWLTKPNGVVAEGVRSVEDETSDGPAARATAIRPVLQRRIRSGADVWRAGNQLYLAGFAPTAGGTLYAARQLPKEFLQRYDEIEKQLKTYTAEKQQLRQYKRNLLFALALVTLLLLFTTTWVALFLSKQVTVPIQALAEGTREISHGNFDYRIGLQPRDELGILVRSFNRMTEQLGEGRQRINEFTQSLEQAVEE